MGSEGASSSFCFPLTRLCPLAPLECGGGDALLRSLSKDRRISLDPCRCPGDSEPDGEVGDFIGLDVPLLDISAHRAWRDVAETD
jgi:hypothetical protein